MEAATTRSSAQIARSRGIGAWVGTLIGAGWLAYGLAALPNAVRLPLAVIGLAVVVSLFVVVRAAHRRESKPAGAYRH